ncbi:MAG TPA: transcription-repair coupling factor, partial [Tetrasphaera australiensis]|nr:transcription-repair coupling factor [Tetrasphaera australiensis]
MLTGVLDTLRGDASVQGALTALGEPAAPDSTGIEISLPTGVRAPLLALASAGRGTLLAVTATAREAEDLAAALAAYLPEDSIATFPSWETLPHERLSPRSDTVGRRLAVLRRLAHPDPGDPALGEIAVLTCSVRALLQPIVKGLGELAPVRLHAGEERPLERV